MEYKKIRQPNKLRLGSHLLTVIILKNAFKSITYLIINLKKLSKKLILSFIVNTKNNKLLVIMRYIDIKKICKRPKPFEFYTAEELWTDEHTARKMLEYHLNGDLDISSKNTIFIKKAVNWIDEYFNFSDRPNVIDFGCGPGLYTTRFAQKGARVTGIDFSYSSIQYAKKTAAKNDLDIEYIHQNYLNFESKHQFDLITMIMCDFCALSPQQRKIMLNKFKELLKPNGSILLDIYTLNMFEQKEEIAVYELNQLDHFWSANEYYAFLNVYKYEKEKLSLDKYTIFEDNNNVKTIYNWLQYFDKTSIQQEFEENGLKIKEFYNDIAGKNFASGSNEMAIIAQNI